MKLQIFNTNNILNINDMSFIYQYTYNNEQIYINSNSLNRSYKIIKFELLNEMDKNDDLIYLFGSLPIQRIYFPKTNTEYFYNNLYKKNNFNIILNGNIHNIYPFIKNLYQDLTNDKFSYKIIDGKSIYRHYQNNRYLNILGNTIKLKFNNTTKLIKEFPDIKGLLYGQYYKQRIILNNDINDKFESELLKQPIYNPSIINLNENYMIENISDIIHLLVLKNKKIIQYLFNDIIAPDDQTKKFNLSNEQECLNFLKDYSIFFHFNAKINQSIIHLHILKNDIYNNKIFTNIGHINFRNINAYFIYLNYDWLPFNYNSSLIQNISNKTLILSKLIPYMNYLDGGANNTLNNDSNILFTFNKLNFFMLNLF